MIEELRDDHITMKVGGRFKLASLMMKRWIELMQNARPMVEPGNMGDLEIIAKEIMEGKIAPRTGPEIASEETAGEGDDA